MATEEQISLKGRSLLDRRGFMRHTGMALGALGLADLLQKERVSAAADPAAFSGKAPIRPSVDPNNPYAPRAPHFEVPAKQVLVIFCPGAVSHVDTFDHKPELTKLHGKKAPFIPAVTFEGPPGNVAKPFWRFKARGQSGKMTSALLPHLGALADEFCFIHSLHTETSAHPQGENFLHTGFTMEGFPSFGAWVTYALGSENQELPAFVAINDPRGLARSGKNNFGNGFLPAAIQGTDFKAKNPPNNLISELVNFLLTLIPVHLHSHLFLTQMYRINSLMRTTFQSCFWKQSSNKKFLRCCLATLNFWNCETSTAVR